MKTSSIGKSPPSNPFFISISILTFEALVFKHYGFFWRLLELLLECFWWRKMKWAAHIGTIDCILVVCWTCITSLMPLHVFDWFNLVQQSTSLITQICLKTSYCIFFSYISPFILTKKFLRPVWVCSQYRRTTCASIWSGRNRILLHGTSMGWRQDRNQCERWCNSEATRLQVSTRRGNLACCSVCHLH
jgi:hypothetical protein